MDENDGKDLYSRLSAPMPQEALHEEDSRGFFLTSITAAFVIERLNGVFGLLGVGWRYVYTPFRIEGAKNEILTEVCLQWRVSSAPPGDFCPPFDWMQGGGWIPRSDAPAVWSEPVFATGGSGTNKKGSTPWTDATKGAVTNGLSKAASRLGVGLEIFKGESDHNEAEATERQREQRHKPKARAKPPMATKTHAGLQSLEDAQAAAITAFDKLKETASFNGSEDKLLGSLYAAMQKAGLEMPAARLVQVLFGQNTAITARHMMAVTNVLPKLSGEVVGRLNVLAVHGRSPEDHAVNEASQDRLRR